ncbi:MAG: hypothetical protein KDI82_07735 [Gammaproteobacteria bacterium]|nr:hypothetical protein [Gammaproteobacteria bacterium]
MTIPFSELPGRHERHLRRRIGNALFGERSVAADDERLLEAQRLDHEELLAFLGELRDTVQRAVDLKPNEESTVILGLKESLDRLYETSVGLAEEHDGNRAAIAQLIEVIMRNVERGAMGDPQAIDELAQERQARAAHFSLLRWPLVADLLHPQSVIEPGDLAPTLLSADEEELAAALQLFDLAQLSELHRDADQRLSSTDDVPDSARARLQQIVAQLQQLRRMAH